MSEICTQWIEQIEEGTEITILKKGPIKGQELAIKGKGFGNDDRALYI